MKMHFPWKHFLIYVLFFRQNKLDIKKATIIILPQERSCSLNFNNFERRKKNFKKILLQPIPYKRTNQEDLCFNHKNTPNYYYVYFKAKKNTCENNTSKPPKIEKTWFKWSPWKTSLIRLKNNTKNMHVMSVSELCPAITTSQVCEKRRRKILQIKFLKKFFISKKKNNF